MNKYPKNMLIKGNKIFFNSSHVATIKGNELVIDAYLYHNNKLMVGFYIITTISIIGKIFGKDNNEQNHWKLKLLEAFFKNKGTIMPDDWKSKMLKSGFKIND